MDTFKFECNGQYQFTEYKLDLNDNIIEEFESVTAAGISVGGNNRRVGVKDCCTGKRKTAYGYKWRYKYDI